MGLDQDLAAEARTSNRLRGLLTEFHSSLERVLGLRLDHSARLIDVVFDALDEQTVVVPGTGTLPVVIPFLIRSHAAVREQRRSLETQIGQPLEAHPLSRVLTSLPGVGVRTAAALLVTVGDGTSFPTAAHLASSADPAPTTKSSGTSIHAEHAPKGGNRQLVSVPCPGSTSSRTATVGWRDWTEAGVRPRPHAPLLDLDDCPVDASHSRPRSDVSAFAGCTRACLQQAHQAGSMKGLSSYHSRSAAPPCCSTRRHRRRFTVCETAFGRGRMCV